MQKKPSNISGHKRRVFILVLIAFAFILAFIVFGIGEFAVRRQRIKTLDPRISKLEKLVKSNAAYNKALFKGYHGRETEAKEFFRIMGRIPYIYRPFIDARVAPNFRSATVNTNSLSYRGPEFQITKKANIIRILLYGGSFVWGTGALKDNETIAGHLQRFLNETVAGDTRYEVINCGESSYRTTQEVVFLMIEGIYLDPDIVIFLDGANDCARGYDGLPAGYPITFERINQLVSQSKPHLRKVFTLDAELDYLKEQRQLVMAQTKSELFRRMKNAFNPEKTTEVSGTEFVSPEEHAIRHINNLKVARGISETFGFKLAAAIQPLPLFYKPLDEQEKEILEVLKVKGSYRTVMKYWSDHYISYTDAVISGCNETQIPVLDLRKVYENYPEPLYFDHVHVTGEGYRLIAKRLHQWLRDQKMLEKRAG